MAEGKPEVIEDATEDQAPPAPAKKAAPKKAKAPKVIRPKAGTRGPTYGPGHTVTVR